MHKLIAACTGAAILLSLSFTTASQRRSPRLAWPNKRGVYLATSSETIPPFPRALSGYRATGNKDYFNEPFEMRSSTRIGEGNGWEPIYNFPFTMNHCSDGVWMIRWRSADPNIRVASALGYHHTGVIYQTKTGVFGYMQGTNCEEPEFKFAGGRGSSNLVDIYYELKFWQATP